MDDWDDTTDATTAEAAHAARDYVKLQARHTDAGYREGIQAGKLSTLQAGFNDGFARFGAPAGRALGLARGQAAAVLAWQLQKGERAEMVEEARSVARDLGRLSIDDVAEKDGEAKKHAAEHGEAIEEAFEKLGGAEPKVSLDDCQRRLAASIAATGINMS